MHRKGNGNMVGSREKLYQIIIELKELGLIAIKAEFEAEGSRLDELIMLNEVVFRANTNLIIKIGGCEAVRDIEQCKILGSKGIMAPMIETSFAMQKFKGAAALKYGDEMDSVEWIINAETITCYQNFDEILQIGKGFINTVVVGRSDLSASMGVNRDDIDKDIMLVKVLDFAKKSKRLGIKASFGGGVSIDTIPFIMKLEENIDQYETRKVVFKRPYNEGEAKKQILKALEFEMNYLEYKKTFYEQMGREDIGRIHALRERLVKDGAKLR